MNDYRLKFSELEAICENEQCRFNDLFLVGDTVYVMLESEDSMLPSRYRPLLLSNAETMSKIPEILRRLDATEFSSLQALGAAIQYRSEHVRGFEFLKYELYEIVTRCTSGHPVPEGDPFYLELEGCGKAEGLLLSCARRELLTPVLIEEIQRMLQEFNSELNWNVRAHVRDDNEAFCIVFKDKIVSVR